MKTTREILQAQVDSICNLTQKDYQLDHNTQGWRLVVNNSSVDVSPCLTASEMKTWLEAFYVGLQRGSVDLRQR